jgi:hypothetical protein
MEDLTLLTMTGARPEAWSICETLMLRQTFSGSVRWVVVDDGPVEQPVTFSRRGWAVDVVRPKPFWGIGSNTQSRNILAGLRLVKNENHLVVIEDDDWYSPDYLKVVYENILKFDLVGEAPAAYYNVVTGRGRLCDNSAHSGLCSTTMKGHAINCFKSAAKINHKFIDIHLWKMFRGSKKLIKNTRMVVGIKGLPGRRGIGAGHRDTFGSPMNLRRWIGNDIGIYKKWITSGVSNAA